MMLRKAVIIGGSLSGVLCARVLSDYFEDVVIVEKDKLEENSGIRKGVPQANHIHMLLVKGKEILFEFFPDLERELLAMGANKIDFLDDGKYLLPSGWAQRFKSGIVTMTCSRLLLEETARKQLGKFTNIRILDETSVTSFISENNKISIQTEGGNTIQADLIVDCSGRNTKTPTWLHSIGYSKPKESRVDSYVGYATRRYASSKNSKLDWKMLVILNKPTTNPRAGIVYPIEDGKWLVGLSGIGKNYPPTDEGGFLDFVKNLEDMELYDFLKTAIPDSEITGYRIQGSRKYHYDKMPSWPENLIVVGDAVSVFNPFYGQGITSASLGIKVLGQMLKSEKFDSNFTKKFQVKLAKTISLPWVMGTSEDLRWPSTVGEKPNRLIRFIQNHAQRVLLLGPKSRFATKSFLEMMHMTKTPLIIFHPVILLQLFLNSLKSSK